MSRAPASGGPHGCSHHEGPETESLIAGPNDDGVQVRMIAFRSAGRRRERGIIGRHGNDGIAGTGSVRVGLVESGLLHKRVNCVFICGSGGTDPGFGSMVR